MMNGAVWVLRLVRSLPQQLVWEIVSVVFSFLGIRLLLRWMRESRRSPPIRPGPQSAGGAVETLRKELEMAQTSGYFRDRVFHHFRDLAVDVVSLGEGVGEAEARRMLATGKWMEDARVLSLIEQMWKPQASESYSKREGARFLGDLEYFLVRLINYQPVAEGSENGRQDGN
jgi:hypothetical protein